MSNAEFEQEIIAPAQEPAHGAGIVRTYPTFRTVMALMLREMGARYGNSPGGYLWALISPMIMISIMAFAFGLIQRSPPMGNSFIMFYASGFLVFSVFQDVNGPVSSALKYNAGLLQFPTVSWIDTILARFLLNFITGLVVYFMLMYSTALFVGESIRFDVGPMLEGVLMSASIGLGWGSLTCYLFLEVRVLADIWKFIGRILFIASGVIFTFEELPKSAQEVLWWNPLVHAVSMGRSGIYQNYEPHFVSVEYVALFSLITGLLGMFLVRQHHNRLLNKPTT